MEENNIQPLSPGQAAPNFALEDILSGVEISLAELRGKIVVLNFWSYECPWSRRYDEYFASRATKWEEDGVQLLHIKSNVNETPAEVDKCALAYGIHAPVLNDEDAELAQAYGAQTTPHVFVINQERKIVYQGAVDDRSFHQEEATVNYLDQAIEAVRAYQQPSPAETPAYGCAIVREPYEHA